jgi:ABC-2 type transport system permease protein
MIIFTTTLKRIFKQPLNWAFILCFPLLFTILTAIVSVDPVVDLSESGMYFGVVDRDNTALSQTLVGQLKKRYNIRGFEYSEEDITAALTDSDVPWILLIREGYGRDVLAGREPQLEGYCLAISDVSALGGATVQNITRALILLGSDDPAAIAAWESASHVDVTFFASDNWDSISYMFGFFGFVSIFTAYFIIKTLLDDKRGGMPDRLGVLPKDQRSVMLQGTLAAFLTTEITVVLLFLTMRIQLGEIYNAVHLFVLLSMYNLFSVGLVLAIVSVARDLGAASVVMTMLSTVFSMLGGLFWPLEIVPEFMRRFAWFSPGYWLARGLQNIKDITFEGFGMPMLFLAGFVAVTILIGGWRRVQPMEE